MATLVPKQLFNSPQGSTGANTTTQPFLRQRPLPQPEQIPQPKPQVMGDRIGTATVAAQHGVPPAPNFTGVTQAQQVLAQQQQQMAQLTAQQQQNAQQEQLAQLKQQLQQTPQPQPVAAPQPSPLQPVAPQLAQQQQLQQFQSLMQSAQPTSQLVPPAQQQQQLNTPQLNPELIRAEAATAAARGVGNALETAIFSNLAQLAGQSGFTTQHSPDVERFVEAQRIAIGGEPELMKMAVDLAAKSSLSPAQAILYLTSLGVSREQATRAVQAAAQDPRAKPQFAQWAADPELQSIVDRIQSQPAGQFSTPKTLEEILPQFLGGNFPTLLSDSGELLAGRNEQGELVNKLGPKQFGSIFEPGAAPQQGVEQVRQQLSPGPGSSGATNGFVVTDIGSRVPQITLDGSGTGSATSGQQGVVPMPPIARSGGQQFPVTDIGSNPPQLVPQQPQAIGLENLGGVIERLLANPSAFDSNVMQQAREVFRNRLMQEAEAARARIEADAASRGLTFSSVPQTQTGGLRDLESRLMQALSEFDVGLLSRGAEARDRAMSTALSAALNFGEAAQRAAAQRDAVASELARLGMVGTPDINSILGNFAGFGLGAQPQLNPALFALLGQLFGD